MKFRPIAFLLSVVLIVASITIWVVKKNDKYGIDFLGGSELGIRFDANSTVDISTLRDVIVKKGIRGAIVQEFDPLTTSSEVSKDFSIRLKDANQNLVGKQIKEVLADSFDESFTLLKEDFVGPIIGEQIKRDGITAIILSLLGILLYISLRFEFSFALGAIGALVHDVIITTGFFIFFGRELNSPVIAGLLTIVGYSLNDTIVVFDRIRENLEISRAKKSPNLTPVALIDKSLNQTLSRTMLTSVTTFLVVASLWLLGGGAVGDLALTLVIGVIVGTYSSIYIASPIFLFFTEKRKNQEKKN